MIREAGNMSDHGRNDNSAIKNRLSREEIREIGPLSNMLKLSSFNALSRSPYTDEEAEFARDVPADRGTEFSVTLAEVAKARKFPYHSMWLYDTASAEASIDQLKYPGEIRER